MMMLGYGNGIIGFFESLAMIIMMALPLILLVWLSFYFFDKLGLKTILGKSHWSVLTLKTKLARGEISIDEYHKNKQLLHVSNLLKKVI